MFCRKCGNQIEDEDAFCEYCGAPRKEQVKEPNTAARLEASTGPTSTGKQVLIRNPYAGKNLQIVGGFVIALSAVLMLFSCPGSNETEWSEGWLIIGLVALFVGVLLSAIGKFQHWYHAE
jgi:uncharacterized membrane protein YvbJ